MSLLPPILLHYYITERCNCRCTFCDIWKIPTNKSNDANYEDVIINLREAHQLGVRFVDFTGGEPLMHDQLNDMLREAKRLGYSTSITTNCSRYTQRANELKGLVNFLHFSLDGLSASIHDAIRGQNTFKHVMNSLDVAREIGERPDLLFTVSHKNISQLKPLTMFAQKTGLLLVVNPVFAYSFIELPNLDFLQTIERFSTTPFVYINKAFHHLRRRGGNDTRTPRCRVMNSTIVISPDNNVVLPCYHFQQNNLTISTGLECMHSKVIKDHHNNRLKELRHSSTWRYYQKYQGRLVFCQGCHLNCYFDPSFHYKLDYYFWLSMLSKSRYWWDKNIKRSIDRKKFDSRPAMEIATEIMEKYDAS